MTNDRLTETQKWFESIRGKQIDVDNFPKGNAPQCVDVPKHHLIHVLGGRIGSFGNGKDVARGIVSAGQHVFLDPRTTMIQAGDVVSFGKPLGQVRLKRADGTSYVLDAGHVGVAYADQQGNTVRVVDQDGYASAQGVHVSEFPVSYVVGIARPKRYVQAQATTAAAAPTVYVVTTHGLNRRTSPGDLRTAALAYPTAPLYRGARWHGTGRTAKDSRGGTWIEGRSDWEKSAGKKPTWVHGAYLKAVA